MLKLPDYWKVASLDVDCQKTFTPLCPNELPVPYGHTIVKELNGQARFAGYRIGTKDSHHKDAIWVASSPEEQLTPITGDNVDVKWVRHAEIGTYGFTLLDGLPAIKDYDYFVWKGIELDMHPYGACYHDFNETLSTGLIEWLRLHSVTTLIVGGLATEFCVKITVCQLLKNDFNIIVNLGACRGMTTAGVEKAIKIMVGAGAQIIDGYKDLK